MKLAKMWALEVISANSRWALKELISVEYIKSHVIGVEYVKSQTKLGVNTSGRREVREE